jgi:hypothetical protein
MATAKAPSAKQLAAREKFKQMVAAKKAGKIKKADPKDTDGD